MSLMVSWQPESLGRGRFGNRLLLLGGIVNIATSINHSSSSMPPPQPHETKIL